MISVVIPNYNGKKYLKMCLRAVSNQIYTDFEIIVIDNASTDDSYEWLKGYKHITFKRLDKNYGFSRAVNEGIKLAQGEYILLLNNDTELCEGFLERSLETLLKDEKIFSISSQMIQYRNKKLIDDAGDGYTILGWGYKRGDGKSIAQFNKNKKVFSSCAGAALYRKAILEEIGYFDENFFAYMEDVDISYRAMIYGYKNVYCPDAKVYHIGSATSGSKYNDFKVRLAARNNIYVPYKNMPFLQLIVNMPFLLVGFIIKYFFFMRKGFEKEYREGFIEGITTLHKVGKIPFKWKHLWHYIYIEWLLIKNTMIYIAGKLFK
jgi:GT2 family glycosyltransferase